MRRACVVLLFAPLIACKGEVAADFTLDLHPRATLDQSPFEGDVSIGLRVRDPVGSTTVTTLSSDGTTAIGEGFGPIAAGSEVGVLVQSADVARDTYDPASLLAYGEVTLPDALGADESGGQTNLEMDVLVADIDAIGRVGTLDAGHAAVLAAGAMAPDGSVFLFGGTRSLTDVTAGEPWVQRLDPLDDGEWAFDDVDGLPDLDDDGRPDEGVGLAAVTVTIDGEPFVFVSGGRPDLADRGDNSKFAGLFDPLSGSFDWSDDVMIGSRSEHAVLAMDDGHVLIVGGLSGDGFYGTATAEIFSPADRSFQPTHGAIEIPSLGFALASLGTTGGVMCGGAVLDTTGADDVLHPIDTCQTVDPSGSVIGGAQLPVALQFSQAVRMPDGRILLTGGVEGDMVEGTATAASARAFVFDGTWTETAGMAYPRVFHRMVVLPNGQIAVVGGVDAADWLSSSVGAAVQCVEVYNPATDAWSEGSCGSTGSGGAPVVASDGQHEPVVVSGFDATAGGVEVGVLGAAPGE